MKTPTQEGPEIEIGVIVINYNSAQATSRFLADLLEQDRSSFALTVVIGDNSPSDASLESLRQAHRDNASVRFEAMSTNRGYFGAAQSLLEMVWKERLPDWLIVSNADIRLPYPALLSRIANHTGGAGDVIAPRIISAQTGLDQNPFNRRRPSRFRINLNRIIARVPFLFWLLETQCSIKHEMRMRLRNKASVPATASSIIYAPHGAFIVFSKEYFLRGGNFDCGAFLFAEEIFVAETCRRLGLRVMYMPSLEVLHDEHISTSGNPAVRRFQAEAADYCTREFFA
jgi:GT2 family glycosyltransferase